MRRTILWLLIIFLMLGCDLGNKVAVLSTINPPTATLELPPSPSDTPNPLSETTVEPFPFVTALPSATPRMWSVVTATLEPSLTFTPEPSSTFTSIPPTPTMRMNGEGLFYPDWTAVEWGPFKLHDPPGITNPVLKASDIRDRQAVFVADPFLFTKGDSVWYMFFEVFNKASDQGDIGLAVSIDGLNWNYDSIVLDEPFHLSYPQVFEYAGHYYMVPETNETKEIRLYEAHNFPYDWQYKVTLVSGIRYVDPSIVPYDGKLWMFASDPSNGNLYLFYSDMLWSGWQEHKKSPIIENDDARSRPGGRPFVYDGRRLIRLAQDDKAYYGRFVRGFLVTSLTPENYADVELENSPLMAPSKTQDWVRDGIHQMDAWWTGSSWLVAFDGRSFKDVQSDYSIGIRVATEK